MTTPITINDISDLARILRERPEWLDVLRSIVIGEELLNVPWQLAELTQQVSSLAQRVDDLTQQVSSLAQRVDDLTQQVSSLAQRVDDLTQQVSSLAQRVDDLTQRVDDLTQRVDDLTQQVSGLTQRVDDLTQQVSGLTQRVDDLTQQVSGLTQRVDDLTQQVSGLTQRVDDLTQRVDGLTQRVDDLTQRVDGLTQRVDDLTQRVDDLTQRLNNFVEATNENFHLVNQRLDRLEGRFSNFEGSDYERRIRNRLLFRATSRFNLNRPILAMVQDRQNAPELNSVIHRAVQSGVITYEDAEDLHEADLIIKDADNRYLLAEVSITADETDLIRATRRARLLTSAVDATVIPVLVSSNVPESQRALADDYGVSIFIIPYP